jgi:hypothetical protein
LLQVGAAEPAVMAAEREGRAVAEACGQQERRVIAEHHQEALAGQLSERMMQKTRPHVHQARHGATPSCKEK